MTTQSSAAQGHPPACVRSHRQRLPRRLPPHHRRAQTGRWTTRDPLRAPPPRHGPRLRRRPQRPRRGRLIRRLALRTDVYVGVALRSRAAGGRDAVDESHLAFVEIDRPDALRRACAFGHPPTMTSDPHGARHAHRRRTPIAGSGPRRSSKLNRRLARHLGAPTRSTDAARILHDLSVGRAVAAGVLPACSLVDASLTDHGGPR